MTYAMILNKWNKISFGLLTFMLAIVYLLNSMGGGGTTVTVTNKYSKLVTGIYLRQYDELMDHEFGSISPSETVKKVFYFKGDSPMDIRFESIQKESKLIDFVPEEPVVSVTIDEKA